MAVRNIIQIDEEKCDGCGLCVSGCAEGALKVIDGKARLISDVYCDGLGACIGECPNDALTIIQRDAPDFDEEAAMAHVAAGQATPMPEPVQIEAQPGQLACGCPSSQSRELKPAAQACHGREENPASALRNWPVQLHLVPTQAPYFRDADLLIAASCSGFAATNLHQGFLPDRSLIMACPKLDQTGPYEEKLAAIFEKNHIRSLTVLYMTVPCCFGLVHLVRQALKRSGKSIPLRLVKLDVTGDVVEETQELAA